MADEGHATFYEYIDLGRGEGSKFQTGFEDLHLTPSSGRMRMPLRS